jgi:hypothetical protein
MAAIAAPVMAWVFIAAAAVMDTVITEVVGTESVAFYTKTVTCA